MPLTTAGKAILARAPGAAPRSETGVLGCQIRRREPLCNGCGLCVASCPSGAMGRARTLDVELLYDAPPGGLRGELGSALRRVARQRPTAAVEVPERLRALRTISFDAALCLGCGACVRACPVAAIEALPVSRDELEGCEARS